MRFGGFMPPGGPRLDPAAEQFLTATFDDLRSMVQQSLDDLTDSRGDTLQRAKTLERGVTLDALREAEWFELQISWLAEVEAGALVWSALHGLCEQTNQLLAEAVATVVRHAANGERDVQLHLASPQDVKTLLHKHSRVDTEFKVDVPASTSAEYFDLGKRYAVQMTVMAVALGGGATLAPSRVAGFAVSILIGVLAFWLSLRRDRKQRARSQQQEAGKELYKAIENTLKDFSKAWLAMTNRLIQRNERALREALARPS
jgi:hypothetical protein